MRTLRTGLWGLLAAAILLLAGCATPDMRPGVVPESAGWRLSGRVGVYFDNEAWHAHIDWVQMSEDFSLQLTGPLGQGIAQLKGTPYGVWLKHPDGTTRYAKDAETLLETETGWQLPLGGMRYWVRGEPLPGQNFTRENNPNGWITDLEQAGWAIQYGRHAPDGENGAMLPHRIVLTNGAVRVKLVVDRWQRTRGLPQEDGPDQAGHG